MIVLESPLGRWRWSKAARALTFTQATAGKAKTHPAPSATVTNITTEEQAMRVAAMHHLTMTASA